MAMEINSSSVLAKLMGIDRRAPSIITHQRQRVLSESYFQNIASIVRREKSQLDIDEDEFSMAVDAFPGNQGTPKVSEGSDRGISGLHLNGRSSSSRNRLDKKFLSKSDRVELSSGLELQGSSYAFSGKMRESSDPQVLRKSRKHIETMSVAEVKKPSRKSSFLSQTPVSAGVEQNVKPYEKRKGIKFQRKRTKNLNHGLESSKKSSVFPQDIAKQITKEVKQSVWHSYREPSKSGSRSDDSSVSEHEKIMPLSQSLSELENNHEVKSFAASVTTSSIETQNTKKQILDKWTTRKSSQGIKTSREISNQTVNSLQVSGARYLAKPSLFPSAWVPRGRTRPFMLDKNWCLKPRDCGPITVDLQKVYHSQEAFSTPENSPVLQKLNAGEEISTAQEAFNGRASSHDANSPTYHDVSTVLNENENKLSEDRICLKKSVNVDSEELADVEDEKTRTSVKFQWEHLSEELSKCAFVETIGSNFPDNDKQQLKDNAAFEPWSPVSSLEGPEACRQHSEGISSVPEFFSSDLHGLQAKLELIEAASLESGSEGPGMMVSSDDSDEGGSVLCYREDAQIVEMPFISEIRQFSYLDDVLSKAGFLLSNSNFEAKTYCSLGYVLDPSLFKSLEEKYSKQTFWERSDRKLLFDRINLSLMEIVQPSVSVNISRKSVAKRLISFCQGQKTIEQQLWDELLNQEEEFKKKSSDKLCGCEIEWLEVDENVSLLVEEVEFSLIHELIEEFVKGFFEEV